MAHGPAMERGRRIGLQRERSGMTETHERPATTPDSDRTASDTVSVTEAATLLDVSERTARRYAATGKLDAERVTGPDGRAEWRIHRRSVDLMPDVSASVRKGAGRSKAETVPLELYREAQAQLSGALLQVGQLTEVRTRLLLAEQTESTLRERLAEQTALAECLAAELDAASRRRSWFRRGTKVQ